MKPKKTRFYSFYYTVGNDNVIMNAHILASNKKVAEEKFWYAFKNVKGIIIKEVFRQNKHGDFDKVRITDTNHLIGLIFYTVAISICVWLCILF